MRRHDFYNCTIVTTSVIVLVILLFTHIAVAQEHHPYLQLNDSSYFEARGLNVLVFSNWYDGNFSDAKISGVEIIHHGVRTATNGDVRLSPTPAQWDPIPKLMSRKVVKDKNSIEVFLQYPDYDFAYTVKAEAQDSGISLSINLDKPLPRRLERRAGFNLEFLPSAYFEKSFMMDGRSELFPLYPNGFMDINDSGIVEPRPIANGKTLVLAPEDIRRHVTIRCRKGELLLFDGRKKAQNGWYVVRTLIPAGATGTVIEWFITARTIPNWIRQPMIAHSQVGYHPDQKKNAVLEFDKNDTPLKVAHLMKIDEEGNFIHAYSGELKNWGSYLRYKYSLFDFSSVRDSGLYCIEYDTVRTKPFRIAKDVYIDAWYQTLDIYMPVQMDHMFVKEAYRVWHGAAHMDDALQAPVNHVHFDLYAQGPTTDTQYKPGEHIPGLNIGGWFDAGDFDIRTQTQYSVVQKLVQIWETFHLTRDETTIDEKNRVAFIHMPDGKPDLLQQIEHGALALVAQFKAVGHAIPGIVDGDLSHYTHLGDAVSQTDGKIYNPKLRKYEIDGNTSGIVDDRWAFTSRTTSLNYGSIAALAAASRALRGYNDTLSEICLIIAKKTWDDEHSHAPDVFQWGNTTGGPVEVEEFKATVELLVCTRETKYTRRVNELLQAVEKGFIFFASPAVCAIPFMDESYSKKIETLAKNYRKGLGEIDKQNPFGVPIPSTGWGGNGIIISFATTNYNLHKAYPKIIDREFALAGLNYINGCHPGSDISFVSGVGTVSKRIAYGNNRADFSFIAGGVVPGVLILKPDFPENKEDWPFLWGENEYVTNVGTSYIFLVNAANNLLNEKE